MPVITAVIRMIVRRVAYVAEKSTLRFEWDQKGQYNLVFFLCSKSGG
jgi:hypothetical protein